MKMYTFKTPFSSRLQNAVDEYEVEGFLSDEDYPKVAALEVGETYIDEDGFEWRRDA